MIGFLGNTMLKLPRFGIAETAMDLLTWSATCVSASHVILPRTKQMRAPARNVFPKTHHTIILSWSFRGKKDFPTCDSINQHGTVQNKNANLTGFGGGPAISSHFLKNRSSCNPSASNSNFPIRVNKKQGIAHAPKCHGTALLQEMNQSITRFTIKPGPSLKLVSMWQLDF